MKIIFFLTTGLILIAQGMGLFASMSRGSTDFLFTARRITTPQISLVAIDDASLTRVGRWPWGRDVQATLLRAIAKGNPTVIGYDIVVDDPTSRQADAQFAQAVEEIGSVVLPSPAARVTVDIDGDGMVRRLPCVGSFAFAVSKRFKPDIGCPADRLIVNYRLDPRSLDVIPAAEVILGKRIPTTPIVLVGITSPSLQDVRRTPLSHLLLPGVYIHVNAIDTLVSGRALVEAANIWRDIATTMLLGSFVVVLWRVKYIWGLLLLILWSTVPIALSIVGYARGLRVDIWYMEIGLVITYASQLAGDYIGEWRRRQFVTQAFGKYLSPHIVNALIAHPDRLTLGGETRRISVFFSDIRSFTTISESMTPKALVAMLNAFLTFATELILGLDGTVDKYIGDAIVAFWNAPIDQPDHALRAAKAAIAIRDGMGRFDRLNIGIGLHTGDALVGNVGSPHRLSYTAIGDTINTASRLEGITKLYGVAIIASQPLVDDTTAASAHAFVWRKLDTVILKGKSHPLTVYELVGAGESIGKGILVKLDHYEKGRELYARGAFEKAKKIFSQPLLRGDPPSKVLLGRCGEFIKHPPVLWTGVMTITSK